MFADDSTSRMQGPGERQPHQPPLPRTSSYFFFLGLGTQSRPPRGHPNPQDYDVCSVPGKKAFAAGVELRVLTGRRQGRLRGRGVATTEAQRTAGMCFKDEERWRPPGAGETEQILPCSLGRSTALPTPWCKPRETHFGLLTSRT